MARRRPEDLAGWARDADVTLRFIEFMDVGTTNGWLPDRGVPVTEVVEQLAAIWSARTDRASELRAEAGLTGPRVEVSYIGG